MWYHFCPNTNAVIFVVDSTDTDRIGNEAKYELNHLMNAEELKDAPFLVYANKQDIPGAHTTH